MDCNKEPQAERFGETEIESEGYTLTIHCEAEGETNAQIVVLCPCQQSTKTAVETLSVTPITGYKYQAIQKEDLADLSSAIHNAVSQAREWDAQKVKQAATIEKGCAIIQKVTGTETR